MTRSGETVGRRARSPWVDLALWALLFVALMAVYEAVRDLVAPAADARAPFAHAEQVISAQRSLGVLVEPDVQALVHDIPGGRFATTWFYTIAYVAGYCAFFLWVFLRHRRHMRFLMSWYWVMNGIALVIYWLYPLAPPRFMDNLGLEDTTKAALELGGGMSWFEPFRNLFAAMPSMHVGQTVFYALSIMWLVRSGWRWLAWLWPAMMLTTVMATANHYLLDAVAGAACVGGALAITMYAVPGDRPWEVRPVPAPAPAVA